LTLGGETDQTLTIFGESDDRRSGASSLRVLKDTGNLRKVPSQKSADRPEAEEKCEREQESEKVVSMAVRN
jgi:hypothetical protein